VIVGDSTPAPPKPAPQPEIPPLPPLALPPIEDPTKKALARIEGEEAMQRRAAQEADRKAEAFEVARQAAVAASENWRRKQSLVHGQIDALNEQARHIEEEADALAIERDVLARERDANKAAVVKARARNGGYAVLPNKSPNGTWQRPVIVECHDGLATLQPLGISFTMLEMSPLLGPRGPLIIAVARELIRAQRTASPDGAPVIPYIYFIVRPDGIRPYYEARARLEPLGIAFGYELVEQEWEIEFPDFDDLAAWDGSGLPRSLDKDVPLARQKGAADASEFVWPRDRPAAAPGGVEGEGRDAAGGGAEGTQDGGLFVWPTRPSGGAGGGVSQGEFGGPGPGSSGMASREDGRKDGAGAGVSSAPAGGWIAGGNSGLGLLGRDLVPLPATQPGSDSELNSGTGARSGGWRSVRPGSGDAYGPATGQRGVARGSETDLVPLSPDHLPGLDPADGPTLPAHPSTGPATRTPPGSPFGSIGRDRRTGVIGPPGVPAGAPGLADRPLGAGEPPTPIESAKGNRVRIDPSLLAYAGEDADPFGQQPAHPMNTMSSQAGSSPPTGSSEGASAGQPSAGLGRPSSAGAVEGTTSPSVPSIELENVSRGSKTGRDTNPKLPPPKPRTLIRPRAIEVPLDLVVACGPDGVVIHPGGYRLSQNALRKKGLLTRELETIVRNHELIDPMVRPLPRMQFLVEAGGTDTFEEARRQTVVSGLNWPVTIHVSETGVPRIFSRERL
jgi:hypothetical protein